MLSQLKTIVATTIVHKSKSGTSWQKISVFVFVVKTKVPNTQKNEKD